MTERPNTTEEILLAGLIAAIALNIQAGGDLLDILDEIEPSLHADVVEGLARLGLM